MIRLFIELSIFKKKVDSLGGPNLLKLIQTELLRNLTQGAILQGTGGVQKLRVGKEHSGKSGGYRVFYLDLPQTEVTYLMTILDKRDSENISPHEKEILKAFSKAIKGERS